MTYIFLYNIRSMNQNIWGPHLWFSLHTISFVYPLNPNNNDKENYKNFFLSLKNVIPCVICKKNYIRHLNEHPVENFLNSRRDLVYWVIDMHNLVNGEIGKKILSYETVMKKYETVFNKKIELESNNNSELPEYNIKNDDETKNIYTFFKKFGILIFLLIFLIIIFFIIHKK